MWDNETVVLVTSLKKRMLNGKKQVRMKKIREDEAIPLYIRSLFDSRVEAFYRNETPFILKSTSHFQLQNEDLKKFSHRIKNILLDTVTFPENEVEDILRQALGIRLDYIIKPVTTMRSLLFSEGVDVTAAGLEKELDAFLKVLPYAGLLIDACRKRGMETVSIDDYGDLSIQLLQTALGDDPVKVLLRDFSVMVEYLSETKGEEIHRIEGSVLQEFLADRNLWGYRRALDVEMKLGKEDFEAGEFELTLRRYQNLKEEFGDSNPVEKPFAAGAEKGVRLPAGEKESAALTGDEEWALDEMSGTGSVSGEMMKEPGPPVDEYEEIKPVVRDDARETEPAAFDEGSEAVKEEPSGLEVPPELEVSSDFNELSGLEGAPDLTEPDEPAAAAQKPEPPELTEKDVLEPQPLGVFSEEAVPALHEDKEPNEEERDFLSVTESKAKVAVSGYIDSRTEKLFVKKLFSGDQEAYNDLLNKLDQAESWRVAKILIDNELFKRDVDPFSREAIKLVDLVYNCYYPEEAVGGK